MAMIQKNQNGFALLVAVIFTTVFLSLALTLGSLAYKQQILAASATDSQSAFYAADAALECVLYQDERNGLFSYSDWPTTWNHYFNNDDPHGVNGPADPLALTCSKVHNPVVVQDNQLPQGECQPGEAGCPAGQVTLHYTFPINANNSGNSGGDKCADVYIYKYSNGNTFIFSQGYSVKCATLNSASARFSARGLSASY